MAIRCLAWNSHISLIHSCLQNDRRTRMELVCVQTVDGRITLMNDIIMRYQPGERIRKKFAEDNRLSNIRVFALRKCKQNKSLATCIKDELVTLELETIRYLFVLFKLRMEQVETAHRRGQKSYLIKEIKKNLTFHIQIVWFSDCSAAWLT